MKKRRISLLLLVSLLITVTALMSVALVACNKDKDHPDPVTGDEAGVYYYDAGDGEYTVVLGEGTQFALAISDVSVAGRYTLNGESLTLTPNKQGESQISATYANNFITLSYNGAEYRFLKKINYTVTFDGNGGSAVSSNTVINGKKVAKPADPIREGFIFVGWYEDAQFTTPFSFNSHLITADTTVFARWVEKQIGGAEFIIDFDSNGANDPESRMTVGGKLFDLPVPTREGYTFEGWWVSMSGNDVLSYKFDDATMSFDSDTTLHAVWQSENLGSKLAEPLVSVDSKAIRWNTVSGANGYTIKVKDPDGNYIVNKPAIGTVESLDFSKLAVGDFIVEVTAVARAEANSATATRVYRNNGLARVSGLSVIAPSTLLFNEVPNAEKYLISIDCGNKNHSHNQDGVMFDNGTSTHFSFADCSMQNGGIKFAVTAVANGYVSSVSKQYVYAPTLDAVTEFSIDEQTQKLVWNKVDNAMSYMVSVKQGDAQTKDEYVNIGNTNSISLKEYGKGNITVKVYPVSKMYISPKEASYTYNKQNLATPKNIRIKNSVISWDAVAGATSYELRIGSTTLTSTTASKDLSGVKFEDKEECTITIIAKGDKNSLATDPIDARNLAMASTLRYENSTVYWKHVLGASSYDVQVNDDEIINVASGANFAKVKLSKAGENTIKVRFADVNDARFEWVSTTVYAHTLTFISDGGESIAEQYKAVGDALDLPKPTKDGYDFLDWYNTPRGPENNGAAYNYSVFRESGDLVLYACYTPKAYKVKYNYGTGGSGMLTSDTVYYKQHFKLTVPQALDATTAFGGWFDVYGKKYTDDNGNSIIPWDKNEDTELFAFWFENVLSFSLTTNNAGQPMYSVMKGSRISQVSEITIPQFYNNIKVGAIPGNAFKDCSNLITVNIPNTIESISDVSPFAGCTKLNAINIYEVDGNKNVRYWSKDGVVFDNGRNSSQTTAEIKILPLGKTDSYTIPSRYQVPGSNAVVTITAIPSNVFANSSLTRVVIPETVTSIGMEAFKDCTKLSTVVFEIGSQSLSISDGAFSGCTALETISLPSRLSSIALGKYTLLSATGTPASQNVSMEFGMNVTNAFFGCKNLKSVYIAKGNKNYIAEDGIIYSNDGGQKGSLLYVVPTMTGKVEIPSGVESIANGAFLDCRSVTEVIIPSSVISVGECAFYGATGVNKVTFKGGDFQNVAIGKYAFRNCTDLENVTFEQNSNVSSIGEGAFYDCTDTAFNTISLPSGITSIGVQAFRNCTSLRTVIFAQDTQNQITFGNDMFYNCTSLASITLPDNLSKLPGVFSGCASLREVKVSEDNPYFKSIGGVLFDKEGTTLLFYPRSNSEEYVIPETVTTIEDGVFSGNSYLKKITIGKNVTKIGANAFSGCDKLSVINFNEEDGAAATLEIGAYAFFRVGSTSGTYMSLTLPKRTTKVGEYAFADMVYLQNVKLNEGLEAISDGMFCSHSLNSETKVEYSMRYLSDIEIPASVKTIGAYAFYYISNETHLSRTANITFAENSQLTSIGKYAFASNSSVFTSISSITLPNGLKSIGYRAFNNAGITEITIPNSVNVIEAGAFAVSSDSKNKISSVTFKENGSDSLILGAQCLNDNNSLEEGGVFQNNSFESIDLPVRLTFLGANTFANCARLTTVNFGEGSQLKHIGASAFAKSGLTSIEIPESVSNGNVVVDAAGKSEFRIAIGDSAFSGSISLLTVSFESQEIATVADGTNTLSIGSGAFYKTGIVTISLPARLGDYEVAGSSSSEKVKVRGFSLQVFAYGADASQAEDSPLTTIIIDENCNDYCAVDGVAYTKDMTTILVCPAAKADSVTIPASVTKIEPYAFAGTKISGVTFEATLDDAVMVIGERAFYNCDNLTEVELSDNVSEIGNYAFASCDSLAKFTLSAKLGSSYSDTIFSNTNIKEINVSDNNPDYSSEKGTLFNKEKTVLISYSKNSTETTYTVPATVKKIEKNAFYKNTTINKIVLQSGLEEIGDAAFSGCSNLAEINIPNTVNKIGNSAFLSCSSLSKVTFDNATTDSPTLAIGDYAFNSAGLTSIKLPARLATLGTNSFYNNKSLGTVEFENGIKITTINDSMFYGCSTLNNIQLPSSVTKLGNGVFSNCTGLINIEFVEGLQEIGDKTFRGCTNLVSVKFPASLKTMGILTFSGDYSSDYCPALETVEFAEGSKLEILREGTFYKSGLKTFVVPASVTQIESPLWDDDYSRPEYYHYGVFQGCESLTSVTFEDNSKCTVIDNYAFYGCTSLDDFVIPMSVSKLGARVFSSCTSLSEIVIPSTATIYGTYLFEGCSSLSKVTLNERATALPDYMFQNCTSLEQIDIPESVTSFGNSLFANTGFKSFVIPTQMTVIPRYFFDGCSLLESVTLHGAITDIKDNAFRSTALKSITIVEGIKVIDYNAFYGCSELATISLPSTLESIGENAFDSCTSLQEIVIPNGITNIEDETFANCEQLISVKLPSALKYLSASAFENCGNVVFTIDDNAEGGFNVDEKGIVYNGTIIVSVPSLITGEFVIPNTVTGITESAFANSGITKVTLPANMTVIDDGAFAGCSTLKEVVILGDVTEIGAMAFYGCTSLTTINLPSTLKSIRYSAFGYCSSLETISLPSELEELEGAYSYRYGVFQYCTKLKNVVIPNGVKDLYAGTFYGCSSLETVTLPSSLDSFGSSMFTGCTSLQAIFIGGANDKFSIVSGALYSKEPDGRTKLLSVPLAIRGEFTFSKDMYAIDSSSGLDKCLNIETYMMEDSVTDNGYYRIYNGALIALKDSYGRDIVKLYSVPKAKAGTFIVPKEVTDFDNYVFQNCSIDRLEFEGGRSDRIYVGYSTYWINYASVKEIVITIENFNISSLSPFSSYWSKEQTIYFTATEEEIIAAYPYATDYGYLDTLKEKVKVVFGYPG